MPAPPASRRSSPTGSTRRTTRRSASSPRASRWCDPHSASTRSTPCSPRCARSDVDYPRDGDVPDAADERRLGARARRRGDRHRRDRPRRPLGSGSAVAATGRGVPRRWSRSRSRPDKPIIVHTRKRERRCLEILTEMKVTRVDWHCFGGKVNLARSIAEHGHMLSIPANARRSESFTRMLQTLAARPHPARDRLPLPVARSRRAAASRPTSPARRRTQPSCGGCPSPRSTAQIADNFARLFGVAP